MAKPALDYSELDEAARLLRELVSAKRTPGRREGAALAPLRAREEGAALTEAAPVRTYRSERLQDAIAGLCRRGGFSGAVLADVSGFVVAAYESPLSLEGLAAFTTVLGESLARAVSLLGQRSANGIAVDIDEHDKLALRRFEVRGRPYYLAVVCARVADERAEIASSLAEISTVLS